MPGSRNACKSKAHRSAVKKSPEESTYNGSLAQRNALLKLANSLGMTMYPPIPGDGVEQAFSASAQTNFLGALGNTSVADAIRSAVASNAKIAFQDGCTGDEPQVNVFIGKQSRKHIDLCIPLANSRASEDIYHDADRWTEDQFVSAISSAFGFASSIIGMVPNGYPQQKPWVWYSLSLKRPLSSNMLMAMQAALPKIVKLPADDTSIVAIAFTNKTALDVGKDHEAGNYVKLDVFDGSGIEAINQFASEGIAWFKRR